MTSVYKCLERSLYIMYNAMTQSIPTSLGIAKGWMPRLTTQHSGGCLSQSSRLTSSNTVYSWTRPKAYPVRLTPCPNALP